MRAPVDGLTNARRGDDPVRHRPIQRRDDRGRVAHGQQEVAPGGHRSCRHRRLAAGGEDPRHLKRIGDHETLETELASQELGEERAAEGRGHAGGVVRRIGHVRRHHRRHAGVHGVTEGRELVSPEPLGTLRRHRKAAVGIAVRRAVTREVLGAGEYPFGLTGVDPLRK